MIDSCDACCNGGEQCPPLERVDKRVPLGRRLSTASWGLSGPPWKPTMAGVRKYARLSNIHVTCFRKAKNEPKSPNYICLSSEYFLVFMEYLRSVVVTIARVMERCRDSTLQNSCCNLLSISSETELVVEPSVQRLWDATESRKATK